MSLTDSTLAGLLVPDDTLFDHPPIPHLVRQSRRPQPLPPPSPVPVDDPVDEPPPLAGWVPVLVECPDGPHRYATVMRRPRTLNPTLAMPARSEVSR